MNKKAFITGITGQVGSILADYLLDNTDLEIIGMMRWNEPLDNIYHLTKKELTWVKEYLFVIVI